jgi:dihydrofolate reductase
MARIVVSEFVTLDGFIDEPKWTWQFSRGPEANRFKLDELFASDALLLGRVTYEGFAQAWPSMTDDAGFAEKMNGMRKYVVSATMTDVEATWHNTTVLRGEVVREVAELKSEAGGDILVEGSCQLVHTLVEQNLVDEYRLMVFPIVLGGSQHLFPNLSAEQVRLSLTEAKTDDSGVLLLTYEPAPTELPAADEVLASSSRA